MIIVHAIDTRIKGDYNETLIEANDAKNKDNKMRAMNLPLVKSRYICPICHTPLFPKKVGDTCFFSCYENELHTDPECAKPGTISHVPTFDGIQSLFKNIFSLSTKVETPPSNGSESDMLDDDVPLVESDNDDITESFNEGTLDLSELMPLIDNTDNATENTILPKLQPLTTLKQIRTDIMPFYSASFRLHGVVIHSFAVYGNRTYRLFFDVGGIYANGNRVFCVQFEFATPKRTIRKSTPQLILFQVFWRDTSGSYAYKRLALITENKSEFKKVKKKFIKEVPNEIGTTKEVPKEDKQYGLIGANWQSVGYESCSDYCPKCDRFKKNYYCGKCKGLLIAPLISSRQVEKIKLPKLKGEEEKK